MKNCNNLHFERLRRNFEKEFPNFREESSCVSVAKPKRKKKQQLATLVKISTTDRIEEIKIRKISQAHFNQLKLLYLSKTINSTASPQVCYGLFSENKLFGCFGFSSDYILRAPADIEKPTIYLMSDFAVSPTCEKRLSKLVLYCILSKEVKLLSEQFLGKEVKTVYTNVFTDKQVSMKYRDLFVLYIKKENCLGYGSKMGRWTLKEGFEKWRQKS